MTVSTKLAPHPLAELIPSMSDAEHRDLLDDIAGNGQREPITLYEGKVLDGRNRAKVCAELGIEPVTREYDGDDPARFVISENVHRRHLTTTQRGLVAFAFLPYHKERAKERQREHGGTAPGQRANTVGQKTQSDFPEHCRARDAAAAEVGVSGITVARLERVAQERPDLYELVKAGEKSVTAAWSETRRNGGAPSEPPPEIKTNRQRLVAGKAKTRIEKAVGTCSGLARGADGLKIEQAIAVADPEEIQGWDQAFKEATAAISRLRKRLKEAAP